MENNIIETDSFCCEGERLTFSPGFFFEDVRDDIENLSSDELDMLRNIKSIAFPEDCDNVDEELWMTLDDEEVDCLGHVAWVDFSEAADLEEDLCLSSLPALTRVALPPNMENLTGLMIDGCPQLREIHIHQLGAVGRISDYGDSRYSIYASQLADEFYESFADDDARDDFAREAKALYVPEADLPRVQDLMKDYPLPSGRNIDLQPLPNGYSFPCGR